jgi:hypothetical protein
MPSAKVSQQFDGVAQNFELKKNPGFLMIIDGGDPSYRSFFDCDDGEYSLRIEVVFADGTSICADGVTFRVGLK